MKRYIPMGWSGLLLGLGGIYIPIVVLLLLVSGCGFTQKGDFARDTALSKGAQAYDEGLDNAELYICTIASVGSVMRRYGRTQATADAWRAICEGQDGVNLIGPSTKSP